MTYVIAKNGGFLQPLLRRLLLNEGSLVWVVAISSLSSMFSMIIPVLTGNFIDHIREVNVACSALIVLLLFMLTSLCFEMFGRWYAARKSRKLKICLQKALAEEFAAINPGRMNDFMPGEVTAKFIRDADAVATIIQDIAPMTAVAMTGLACAFFITFRRSVPIGSMMALLAVVCAVLLFRYSRSIALANRNNRTAMDNCMSTLFEIISNFPGLKAMSSVSFALSHLGRSFENANSAGWKLDKENLRFESTVKILMFLGEASVLFVAGTMAIKGRLTVGDVIVFQMLFAQTLGSISNAFRIIPLWGYVNEAALSIGELSYFGGKERDEGKKTINAFKGKVELQTVSYAYTGGGTVLNGVSLVLNPNECCALIGANGSGKTTLAKLVGAFFEPKEGSVLFDGVDSREINRESLRQKISFLFQDPMVFTGSIRENVALGKNFSDEELLDVLSVCGLRDFVHKHAEGLDYRIVSGYGLSGGERQRISAARALIRKPSLLVLDEPGNHIDTSGIYDLKKIIEFAKCHSSILLITHDKTIAAIADRVVSMDNAKRKENE